MDLWRLCQGGGLLVMGFSMGRIYRRSPPLPLKLWSDKQVLWAQSTGKQLGLPTPGPRPSQSPETAGCT